LIGENPNHRAKTRERDWHKTRNNSWTNFPSHASLQTEETRFVFTPSRVSSHFCLCQMHFSSSTVRVSHASYTVSNEQSWATPKVQTQPFPRRRKPKAQGRGTSKKGHHACRPFQAQSLFLSLSIHICLSISLALSCSLYLSLLSLSLASPPSDSLFFSLPLSVSYFTHHNRRPRPFPTPSHPLPCLCLSVVVASLGLPSVPKLRNGTGAWSWTTRARCHRAGL
jgi:hypothetical protein